MTIEDILEYAYDEFTVTGSHNHYTKEAVLKAM